MASSSCSSGLGAGQVPDRLTKQVPQMPVRQPNRMGEFCAVRAVAKVHPGDTAIAAKLLLGNEMVLGIIVQRWSQGQHAVKRRLTQRVILLFILGTNQHRRQSHANLQIRTWISDQPSQNRASQIGQSILPRRQGTRSQMQDCELRPIMTALIYRGYLKQIKA